MDTAERRQLFQLNLEKYVQLELEDKDADKAYPDVSFFIQSVQECEEAYYSELMHQLNGKSLEELRSIGPHGTVIDLIDAILAEEPAIEAEPSWVEKLTAHGRTWYDDATDQLRQFLHEIDLSRLGSGPAPAYSGLMSGDDGTSEDKQTSKSYTISDDEMGLVMIVAKQLTSEYLCNVEITVSVEELFGDFSGITIILQSDSSTFQQATDMLGKAVFNDIDQDTLDQMSVIMRL